MPTSLTNIACQDSSISEPKIHSLQKEIIRHIPSRKFCLRQSNFEKGTFRIRKPGRYVLGEDIIFHPHPQNQFRPPLDSKYSQLPAYSLGFFAALTIECDGVEIDLAGHSISQSEACALFQRYYAHIELASTPFLPRQGPGNFGSPLIAPKWIWIHNGILGRSSHHGIHGNGNRWVYLEQLEIRDFEFVGVALNGARHVVYDQCHIHHNWCSVPVKATWSAALYLEQFVERILRDHKTSSTSANPSSSSVEVSTSGSKAYSSLKTAYATFKCLLEMTKLEILAGRPVSHPLFSNLTGFPDGNVFGIVSNPLGVAIHDFARPTSYVGQGALGIDSKFDEKRAKLSQNIIVWRCHIHNLTANVEEIMGLAKCDGSGIHKGVSGELFRIQHCSNARGEYVRNAWTDVLMELSLLKQHWADLPVGTLYISPDILDWFRGRLLLPQVLQRGYKYLTGLDAMAHTNKGVLGIRWDGTEEGIIYETQIDHLTNIGAGGSSMAPGGVLFSYYLGTMTCGIHLAFSSHIKVGKVSIHDLYSENGLAVGVRSIHESSGLLSCISIQNLRSGKSFENGCWWGSFTSSSNGSDERETQIFQTRLPNAIPESVGLYMTPDSHLDYADLRVEFLYGPQTRLVIIGEK
jgi:hypothetical protein